MHSRGSERTCGTLRGSASGVKEPATVRAFFALWPDAAARAALAKLSREVAAETAGRAPMDANLHLTLAFLGEVPESRLGALNEIGAVVAATTPACELSLDRVGSFRGSGIAWAGASEVPAELARLVAELGAALAAGGFVLESRPFQAHVTLARRCRKRADRTIAPPIVWPVTRLVLNASDLSSGGPQYRAIAGWPFGTRTTSGQATGTV